MSGEYYEFRCPNCKGIKAFSADKIAKVGYGMDCPVCGSVLYSWNATDCKAIKDAGGIEKDSIWAITKRRGNSIGTLMVSQKDNTGHLRYSKTKSKLCLVWFGLYICPYKPKPIYIDETGQKKKSRGCRYCRGTHSSACSKNWGRVVGGGVGGSDLR